MRRKYSWAPTMPAGPDRTAKITAMLEDGSLTNIDISEIKRINILNERTGKVTRIERSAA